MLLSRKRDIKLGGFLIILNAVVVIIAGFFFTWDVALTSLLSIYVTGKVIDAIHTKHRKVTLMIVTNEAEKNEKNNFFQLLYVALHYLMAKVLILAKRNVYL